MDRSVFRRLQEKALSTARRIGLPSFYARFGREMDISQSHLTGNPVVCRCRASIDLSGLHPAHGMDHGEKVACEAGAIIQAEGRSQGMLEDSIMDMLLCVQIAGLLHDIKRNETDHTIKGGLEAERILRDFELKNTHKRYIIAAIRNHEAFREVLESEDGDAKLISDSLYDADKFRWGPDNFTRTLWLILESTGTSAERLYEVYDEKLDWIRRIKGTFRTDIGRHYGPEFIDMGMEIGNEIYLEMKEILKG